MITWAEIVGLLRIVWRWIWVVILAVVLSAGAALILSQYEQRLYVARATLSIGNAFESARPAQDAVQVSAALGNFYAELARRERVLLPVQQNLQLNFPWQIIVDDMLSINVSPNTGLLEIYITDTSPERAAAIANAIGEQLITYSPTSPEKIEAERQVIETQLKESDQRISDLQQRINTVNTQIQRATSASDLNELNARLTELQLSLGKEQDRYNSLLNTKSSSALNSLRFFELATPPGQPLPSKRLITILVAMVAGLLLSLAAIFLLDRLDTRWRGSDDTQTRFSLRSLGDLPKSPPIMSLLTEQASSRHDAVRTIQSNILLAASERGITTLMLTSPKPTIDRTSLAIDLADLFARTGQRVLLVDADPISAELTRRLHTLDTTQSWNRSGQKNEQMWVHFVATSLSNVALLPASASNHGQPAMLSAARWRELSEMLTGLADIIIFDGPSTLVGPDAALLAGYVDGTILTLDPSVDSRDDVATSKERLIHLPNAHLLGAVTFRRGVQSETSWILPDKRHLELPEPKNSSEWYVEDQEQTYSPEESHEFQAVNVQNEQRVIVTPAGEELKEIMSEQSEQISITEPASKISSSKNTHKQRSSKTRRRPPLPKRTV